MKSSKRRVTFKKVCAFILFFFLWEIKETEMPKVAKSKIYKVTRKNISDDKNNFVVRWKTLSKEEIKQLRVELQDVVDHFFDRQERQERQERPETETHSGY